MRRGPRSREDDFIKGALLIPDSLNYTPWTRARATKLARAVANERRGVQPGLGRLLLEPFLCPARKIRSRNLYTLLAECNFLL